MVLKSILAQDDNSGENNQPFIEYHHEVTTFRHARIKIELGENAAQESGPYTLNIFAPEIEVDNPNGGEWMTLGETIEITWTDNIDENVRIDLWKGGTYNEGGTQIPITTSTESDGSYLWNIPIDLERGSDYKIRVKSTNAESVEYLFDYSDEYFSIATDISNTPDYAKRIFLPHEQNYFINSTLDVDWFNFVLELNSTYRIYCSSLENIDSKLTMYAGQWEYLNEAVLHGVVASDDNSGGNNQPFIEFNYNDINSSSLVWLKVELSENADPTTGDYRLHIFKLCDKINLKTFLEGAYANELNDVQINFIGNLPKNSPYGDNRSVEEIPENVADWVFIELRDKDNMEAVETSISAFLLKNGNIVDLDGESNLQLNAPADSYYVVVKHRNHLPIMSKDPIPLFGN